jgi:hypothetical protein
VSEMSMGWPDSSLRGCRMARVRFEGAGGGASGVGCAWVEVAVA